MFTGGHGHARRKYQVRARHQPGFFGRSCWRCCTTESAISRFPARSHRCPPPRTGQPGLGGQWPPVPQPAGSDRCRPRCRCHRDGHGLPVEGAGARRHHHPDPVVVRVGDQQVPRTVHPPHRPPESRAGPGWPARRPRRTPGCRCRPRCRCLRRSSHGRRNRPVRTATNPDPVVLRGRR